MIQTRLVANGLSVSAGLLTALLLASCATERRPEEFTHDGPGTTEPSSELSVPISNPGFESDKANWGDPSLFELVLQPQMEVRQREVGSLPLFGLGRSRHFQPSFPRHRG